MKLLVDIGNSQVKWSCLNDDGLTDIQSFKRNKTGIKASLNKAWKTLTDIEAVYISNVAGDKIAEQLSDWTEKTWQITPKFIHSEKKRFGVTNSYKKAEQLGVDRWLGLVATRQHARQAACIIDCGTAVTIDIITKQGQHQGGMILPGLSLMRTILCDNTDALTEQVDEAAFSTMATNTFSAIQAGTLYCLTATLERIFDDLNAAFDNQVRFIVTGGDAENLMPMLPENVLHYPDLVLRGLACYARQDNRNKRNNKETEDSEEYNEQPLEQAAQLPEHAN